MKIGILNPRSTLCPGLNFELLAGLREGLKRHGLQDQQIIHRGINFAEDARVVYKSCEELLFEGADIIVAYFSPRLIPDISPMIRSAGAFLIHLDYGYALGHQYVRHPHTVTLSLEGAVAAAANFNRVVAEGKKEWCLSYSYYDCGYSVPPFLGNEMERTGIAPAGYFITKLKRTEFNIDDLRAFCFAHPDAAVFLSMCGEMAEDFVRDWTIDPVPANRIVGSVTMGDETLLDTVKPGNAVWEVVVPWGSGLSNPENQMMLDKVGTALNRRPTIFSVLGWDAARLVAEIRNSGKNAGEMQAHFEGFSFDSPRGTITIGGELLEGRGPLYLAHVSSAENGFARLVIDPQALQGLEELRQRYAELGRAQASVMNGWINAYMCI